MNESQENYSELNLVLVVIWPDVRCRWPFAKRQVWQKLGKIYQACLKATCTSTEIFGGRPRFLFTGTSAGGSFWVSAPSLSTSLRVSCGVSDALSQFKAGTRDSAVTLMANPCYYAELVSHTGYHMRPDSNSDELMALESCEFLPSPVLRRGSRKVCFLSTPTE